MCLHGVFALGSSASRAGRRFLTIFLIAVLNRGDGLGCRCAVLVAPCEPVVPKKFGWVWRALIGTGHCVSGTKLIAAPADALRMVRVNGKLLGH